MMTVFYFRNEIIMCQMMRMVMIEIGNQDGFVGQSERLCWAIRTAVIEHQDGCDFQSEPSGLRV